MFRNKAWFRACACLILLSLPARFGALRKSLWMDEAWVANSVLEPSLHDMFFTTTWNQSSPPLFLLLERWMVAVAGSSEAAFRILPLAASLIGLFLAALALRRWLLTPAALFGLTLLCGNYWAIKYPQQVKQYGIDFGVSALLVWLVGRYLESLPARPINAGILWLAGIAGMFLSYTTVFWLPTLLICAAIQMKPDVADRFQWSGINRSRPAYGIGLLVPSLAILQIVFIRPGRTAAIMRNFEDSYFDWAHPLRSLETLTSSIGTLVISVGGVPAFAAGLACAALLAYATASSASRAKHGELKGVIVLLAGALPLGCALAAGALRFYPALEYPRMLLFALPGLALTLGYAIDALLPLILKRSDREVNGSLTIPVFIVCLAAVLGSQIIYFRYPRPAEENRPAIAFIQSHLAPRDVLFVQGGMYEQFKYYRAALDFYPGRLYIGKAGWPCCATGDVKEATDPSAKSFACDLSEAGRRAGGHRLWLLFPAGTPGHWSSAMRSDIDAMPAILARADECRLQLRKLYGQTLVESYACR